MKLSKLTTLPFAALALLAVARAQTTDAETWARAIVDSPHQVTGDDDALVSTWLDMLEHEPGHPLAEAMLRAIELTGCEHPRQVAEHLARIDAARMQPIAASVLAELRSTWRAEPNADAWIERAAHGELFPGYLRTCKVLGPLSGECDAHARDELFASPGFDAEHVGARELKLRWLDVERSLDAPAFTVEDAVSPEVGWAVTAFLFDVPQAGPGWIEIDCRDASGPRWLLAISPQDRDWRGNLRNPSFSFAFDGAPPVAVDFLSQERSLIERAPVVLRSGRNRLLLASNLDARLSFAVRVLDANGRPMPGLVEAHDDRPLGAQVAATAGPKALATSEAYLRQLANRGPDTEALLGVLEMLDGRPGDGLVRVKHAAESAPDRVGLQALLAQAYIRAPHVPDSWKRGRSREISEKIVAAMPEHLPMQLALARVLGPEDHEEDALAKLDEIARRNPKWAEPKLVQANTLRRLDLDVPAERALFDALERAPDDLRVLDAVADHLTTHGNPARALALRQHALATNVTADALQGFASVAASAGDIVLAEANYRASAKLGATWQERSALANFLIEQRRYDEADQLLAHVEQELPYEPWFAMRRADVARLRGDDKGEIERLREALRRSPSHDTARARIFAATGHEAARDFEQRYALDVTATLASFDPNKWNDSVVRVIDDAVVYVFEDGGYEQFGRTRNLVRDLQGCESEGKQSPPGDVLKIATIKASDGKEYEPTAVDGEYVMPSLEPGDTVEYVNRYSAGPPDDGVVRLGQWSFASVDAPFHLSRYVVSLPKSLGLRMVLRNFDGEHREIDEGDRVVHVLEVHDHPRVLLEPASPPANWILPWVVFGRDRERDDVARSLVEGTVLPLRVSPEISAAAAQATEGLTSEEDKARVLHHYVSQALDKRAPGSRSSALAALLSREGNGTWLYAALLDAAGIDHDVVWSRNVTPAGDPDPEPAFVDANRWMNKLLVLVKPKDGPESWCDMASRTLPYGVVIADAPGASAFAVHQRAWIEMPDCPLAERTGERHDVRITLDGTRGAAVEVTFGFSGNIGHALKERFREAPKAQLKRVVQQIASSVVANIDVSDYDVPGLDSESDPASFHAKGKIKSFLDEAGGEYACKLPFPALEIGKLAAGEGTRKYPFFLGQSTARSSVAHFELPAGWKLSGPFKDLVEDFRGGSYRLVLEQDGEKGFTLRRELFLPPMVLEPAAYPDFVAFAKRIDEAERTRLKFVKPQ